MLFINPHPVFDRTFNPITNLFQARESLVCQDAVVACLRENPDSRLPVDEERLATARAFFDRRLKELINAAKAKS